MPRVGRGEKLEDTIKLKCKEQNKDYNPKTKRCNKPCEKNKIRDLNFRCIKDKDKDNEKNNKNDNKKRKELIDTYNKQKINFDNIIKEIDTILNDHFKVAKSIKKGSEDEVVKKNAIRFILANLKRPLLKKVLNKGYGHLSKKILIDSINSKLEDDYNLILHVGPTYTSENKEKQLNNKKLAIKFILGNLNSKLLKALYNKILHKEINDKKEDNKVREELLEELTKDIRNNKLIINILNEISTIFNNENDNEDKIIEEIIDNLETPLLVKLGEYAYSDAWYSRIIGILSSIKRALEVEYVPPEESESESENESEEEDEAVKAENEAIKRAGEEKAIKYMLDNLKTPLLEILYKNTKLVGGKRRVGTKRRRAIKLIKPTKRRR